MSNHLSDQARTFLQERRFGVLATINKDGSPQLTVMWFLLDGDTIVMNTKADRVKDSNMRRDPRVALCVEEGYSYVTISGTIETSEDQPTAQADIYRLAVRYNGEEQAKKQMATFAKETRVTLRLQCHSVMERF